MLFVFISFGFTYANVSSNSKKENNIELVSNKQIEVFYNRSNILIDSIVIIYFCHLSKLIKHLLHDNPSIFFFLNREQRVKSWMQENREIASFITLFENGICAEVNEQRKT